MNRTLLAFAAAACLAAPAAFAAGADAPRTTTVAYDDLNLNSPAGVETLYARLRGAAQNVCGDRDFRTLRARAAYQSCYSHALDTAVAGVNHDSLTARHLGKSAPARFAGSY